MKEAQRAKAEAQAEAQTEIDLQKVDVSGSDLTLTLTPTPTSIPTPTLNLNLDLTTLDECIGKFEQVNILPAYNFDNFANSDFARAVTNPSTPAHAADATTAVARASEAAAAKAPVAYAAARAFTTASKALKRAVTVINGTCVNYEAAAADAYNDTRTVAANLRVAHAANNAAGNSAQTAAREVVGVARVRFGTLVAAEIERNIVDIHAIAAAGSATYTALNATTFAEYIIAEVVGCDRTGYATAHDHAASVVGCRGAHGNAARATGIAEIAKRDANNAAFADAVAARADFVNEVIVPAADKLVEKVKELDEFFNNWQHQRT
ncbi:hypothetical protein AGMMS50233_00720 [Endomicrobiia bacterium]|nr:hypothetical protein AGMMS50233_00720 [Endomicrobiia bacterium]